MDAIEKAKNNELIEEMKDFFKVSSLEDVAEKLGYKRNTATTWRSKGITKNVYSRFKNHISDSNSTSSISQIESSLLSNFKLLDKADQKRIYEEIKKLASEKLDLSHLDEE